jgi:phosphoglycerate dehydrogenase-like enzyme
MRICVVHTRLGEDLRAELARRCPGDEVVAVGSGDDPPDPDAVEVVVANTFRPGLPARCPRLRLLQLTSAGTDQLDGEVVPPGLAVAHAGTVPARAVAEFAWMGVLALSKDGPGLWRRQAAREWRLASARLVAGTTMVLVGLGHVGREVAGRARAFDVRVVAVTRSARPSPLADEVVGPGDLATVAPLADHLVLAAPATEETRGLVGPAVVAALPEGAAVVNVGRASLLDTDALVAALRAGRLRGALLDVHDEEPLPADSPLWDVEGLWVTPHTAFAYPGEAADLAALAAENVALVRAGRPPRNAVDRSSPAAG